ncbi:MAG TPA: hypothetical protein VH092_37580, partial [Urbifossiella sp.]|nr:hypothetical protein [Urbifossiella sp.]
APRRGARCRMGRNSDGLDPRILLATGRPSFELGGAASGLADATRPTTPRYRPVVIRTRRRWPDSRLARKRRFAPVRRPGGAPLVVPVH